MATAQQVRELAATKKHRLAPYLLDGRDLPSAQADAMIRHLQGCPPAEGAPPAPPAEPTPGVPPPLSAFMDMPEGYYATRRPDGSVDFWRVDKGKKGKWEGYSFPRRVLGGDAAAGEEIRTVELGPMQKRLALQEITEFGLDEAGTLFASELTRCRDCGRFLTDEESRAAGRGPVCRARR